jgi:DNA-directed RNA polymerase specialized sigma subunit
MSKLGMNSGIFKDSIEESKKAMQEAAEAAARNGEHISKTAIMMKGLGPLASGFGKALLDPLTIITAILDGFFRVNKASVEVQQLTGQYETSIAGVNDRLATSAQFLQTAAELTKQLGVSATLVFAPDQIAQLAEAKNLLGLSAEQAGRMGILMKTTGKSADQVGQGIYDTVNAYNGANRAGIAHGVVLQDVLGASDSITASLGNSEKKIGAAAVAARGLGLSLSEVDEIAGSFLNFEDSISAELEAQLLTGKNLNLSKARELALNNDLEGVANELKKNGASAAEYAGMNRLEQESLAKALGMSRDQLAKSVLTQEAMKNMTDEQIAKARGVTLEQSKAMDVQEKMQVGMQKLAEAFAPVLDVVVNLVDALMFVITPVAKLIAMVVGNPIGKAILLAVVAANFLGVAVSGVGKAFGSMYQLGAKALTGITSLFKSGGLKSALGGLKDNLTGGFKGGAGGLKDKIMGPAADKTKSLAGDAGGADAKKGGGIKGFLKGLGDGLASMGKQMGDIIKGAIALGIAGVAIAGGLAIAMMIIKDVDPAKMLAFTGSIAMLGLTLAIMGKIGGNVIQGALALGIVALALIPAAYAFSLLKDVDTDKIIAFSIAVPLLALAAAGLGFLLTPIAMGALALAALGVGLMAVGAGFMVLTAGQAGFGLFNQLLDTMADKGVAAGLGLGATGIGMGLLGAAGFLAFPGMLLAAVAMSAMIIPLTLLSAVASAGVLPILATTLMQIAAAAPGLLGVGMALFSIAAGLGAVALAGVLAIPAIGGAVMLAAVSPALVSLAEAFGMGGDSAGEAKGKSEEGSMAVVEAKLTELIAVVKAGGNVYLDSNKVGRAQVLGSYKSS